MEFEKILDKLVNATNMSRDELRVKIDDRQKSLSGMITFEGAALLVAKEFGVDIFKNEKSEIRRLKIKNIVPGMKKVNAVGRVFRVSSIKEFNKKNGNTGKVCNIFVGDSTGFFRMPLWNDQAKLIEDEEIKVGDVLQVVGAYARENVYGDVELSVGKYGSIKLVEDGDVLNELDLPKGENLNKMFMAPERKKALIKNLLKGHSVGNFKLRGTITDVFKGNFVFYSAGDEDKTNPEAVVSCVIDDSTGALRIVLFRDVAERLCDIDANTLAEMNPEKRYNPIREKLIGRELVFEGRVQKNKFSGDIEMIVDKFKDLNIKEESEKLIGKLKMKIG